MPFGIRFDTNVHLYTCSSTDLAGPWRPSLFEKHSSNPVSQMERCYTTSQTGNGKYHYQHRQPSKSKADFERLQQRPQNNSRTMLGMRSVPAARKKDPGSQEANWAEGMQV